MNKQIGFLMLLVCLTACCIQIPSQTNTTTTLENLPEKKYTGFMTLSQGDWAEYALFGKEGSGFQKIYYLGSESMSGQTLSGLEVQLKNGTGHVATFQIWIDPSNGTVVEYAARINGKVLCTRNTSVTGKIKNIPSLTGTPDKYAPGKSDEFELFTISGKKMYAVKYQVGENFVYVSGSVPFGIVRATETDGKTDMELTDYGTGMKRTISRKELDACKPI